MSYVYIVLGAVAGAPLRYFLQGRVDSLVQSSFPVGTFVVNVTGCLAIGLLLGLAEERGALSRETRLLLVTGFLGSYTTFSAFGAEAYGLLREDDLPRMLLYAVSSVVAGI